MNLKRVCVCGHFGFGENLLNGQTVKTKIVTSAIKRSVGSGQVVKLDTAGGMRANWLLPFRLLSTMRRCKNIVMLPAENGLRILTPLISFYNRIFHRATHYVVVGGWLPAFISGKKSMIRRLKRFTGIYVETQSMMDALTDLGFGNVYLMPNCKELKLLTEKELVYERAEPYRLCTFTRVMKEKGISDAIEAVRSVNVSLGRTAFTLDVYGQIGQEQKKWFHRLQKRFPEYVMYGGVVPYNKSVEVLKDYFAVLFPTYYEGEGFAGTIIDAHSAGVPIIASDWKYNHEIVRDGVDGAIVPPRDVPALHNKLLEILDAPEKWNAMKVACLERAAGYMPNKAIGVLLDKLL
ncbi:MAG: glycosyltransferase [Clostridia bacterium]|nr:glycosyltransferase [Clostridia bacterium]